MHKNKDELEKNLKRQMLKNVKMSAMQKKSDDKIASLEKEVELLKQKLNDYSLETTDLVIHQTSTNQAFIVEMQNEIEKLKSKVEKFEKDNHE